MARGRTAATGFGGGIEGGVPIRVAVIGTAGMTIGLGMTPMLGVIVRRGEMASLGMTARPGVTARRGASINP